MNWRSADSFDGRYFGALPTISDHRNGGASLDRRGEMTMPQNRKSSVILCSVKPRTHSSVPAKTCTAVARSVGPGSRQAGARAPSPLTAASTMAALRSLGTISCASCDLGSIDAVDRRGTRRAGVVGYTSPNELSVRPFAAFVTEASKRFGVPEHWIRAVLRVESGAKQRARSSKGAMGLMQIMPKTWTELRARYGLGAEPFDPHDNIWPVLHTSATSTMVRRARVPRRLQCGTGRYERHLATGRPLPDETQAYVATLAPMINRARPTCSLCCRKVVAGPTFTVPFALRRHLVGS